MPSLIYLDLAPRRCDDREFSSERINAQIVAPCQVDTVDGPRKILSALLCGGCVGERQLSVNGHEEFWARVEELEPRQWPLLSDIMGHSMHERARAFVDGGSTSRCKRL